MGSYSKWLFFKYGTTYIHCHCEHISLFQALFRSKVTRVTFFGHTPYPDSVLTNENNITHQHKQAIYIFYVTQQKYILKTNLQKIHKFYLCIAKMLWYSNSTIIYLPSYNYTNHKKLKERYLQKWFCNIGSIWGKLDVK